MKKDDASFIYQTLCDLYTNFESTENKAYVFVVNLMEMDYQQVWTNVLEYAATSPFPPKLSDIAAPSISKKTKEDNQYLANLEEWKKEADKVPEETKQRFKQKLQELSEVKKND